jgi:sn-glycerol 3-phosphate transport system permease protein
MAERLRAGRVGLGRFRFGQGTRLTRAWFNRAWINVALGVVALAWLLPYAWMVVTSLRPVRDIVAAPAAFPETLTFAAYREVWAVMPIAHYFWTTTLMAAAIAALQIAVALPAAYALAKLEFTGKSVAFGLIVATLLVPAQVRFVPIFALLAELGLVNTLSALVLPFGVSALGIFLLRQALGAVPNSLIEAARLDGASELVIIYRLLPPLVRPALVSFALFSFVYHWNDYFWPLVMTTDDAVRTLPLGIALLREQGTGVRWHLVMAGNVILSAPALLVFAFTQKYLVRAVARGA